MESVQESVSDPSNIIHSMKKRPVLHVCDDPCTLVEYELVHYPEDSDICFSGRKGCFETPKEGHEPLCNIDCKVSCVLVLVPRKQVVIKFIDSLQSHDEFKSSIRGYDLSTLPPQIEYPTNLVYFQDIEPIQQETNREHFGDGNPLDHPDSSNRNRYVFGTRLQSKSGHKGHKRDTCAYHNLDLSQQGATIKSMTQESMQNVRKFRSIQQDKLRKHAFKTFTVSYEVFSYF